MTSTPVRLGIQLPEVERVVRWPELAAIASAAEDAGFDSIWIGDHLLYRGGGRPERGPWEAFATLAALAEAEPEQAAAQYHRYGASIGKNLKLGNEIENGHRIARLLPQVVARGRNA